MKSEDLALLEEEDEIFEFQESECVSYVCADIKSIFEVVSPLFDPVITTFLICIHQLASYKKCKTYQTVESSWEFYCEYERLG
jgi:hypothetical protein